jgi:hypothetical protein
MSRFASAGIVALVAAVLVAVGWSVAGGSGTLVAVDVQDGPRGGSPCADAATIEGTLDSNASWVISGSAATVGWHVVWPNGYAARQTSAGLELLNADGAAVARVGDRVRVAGSEGSGGRWFACADAPAVLAP